MERPKLELELNKPTHIKMLFDQPIIGESQYGKYYMYAVTNGDPNKELTFFAPNEEVHNQLKDLKKGTAICITKLAAQRGNKLVTTYDVQMLPTDGIDKPKEQPNTNPAEKLNSPDQPSQFLTEMIKSFEEAIKIQEKFNGMANVNQIAITLFIQRTKGNHAFVN